MKLLVGLGNPGAQYEKTFHNVGFGLIDKLAYDCGAQISRKKAQCLTGECEINGQTVLLAKPQTYMNLSGNAVLELKKKYGLKNQDIFVVVDDIDLPLGTYRFKTGGSGGTHNGMRSIVWQIGADFPRLRIGIGRPENGEDLADYVLKKIPSSAQEILNEVTSEAIEFIKQKLGE